MSKFQISRFIHIIFRHGLKFQALPIIAAFYLITTVAFAAEGGHEEKSDMVWRIINFLVLAAALYFLLAKKIKNFLYERRESIKKALEEARTAREEAEKKYKEYEAKVAVLDKKVLDITEQLLAEGIAEKDRIIEEAQKVASKIKEQTKIAIEQEIKKAKEGIKGEVINLAIIMAEEILRKEIKPDDQTRLIKEYIERMRLH